MLSRRWSLARGRLALQIDAMAADSSLRHHRRRQSLSEKQLVTQWQGWRRLLALCFLAIPGCSFVKNRLGGVRRGLGWI
jgi:hypothetical protein